MDVSDIYDTEPVSLFQRSTRTVQKGRQTPAEPVETAPVDRVVLLLQKMLTEVQNDAASDTEFFQDMTAYCESAKAKATFDIENSNARVMEAKVTALTAEIQKVKVEVADLQTELADGKAELATMIKVYQDKLESAHKDEVELVESIGALKSANAVLGKQSEHGSSVTTFFLQAEADAAHSATQAGAKLYSSAVAKIRSSPLLLSLLRVPPPPQSLTKYSNSGAMEVIGILQNMQVSFEEDLAKLQGDTAKAKAEFAELKVSKTEVIQNNEESLTERQERSAAAKVELSTVKRNMERADDTYQTAKELLSELNVSCAVQTDEYNLQLSPLEESTPNINFLRKLFTKFREHFLQFRLQVFSEGGGVGTSSGRLFGTFPRPHPLPLKTSK